jgi:hypothetical protein
MPQTRQHSRLEVAVDVLLMLMVNIGGQMLVYGAAATTWRAGAFAAATLALATPRRYATRRLFNALVVPGEGQSPWHSWLEVSTGDTYCGGSSRRSLSGGPPPGRR